MKVFDSSTWLLGTRSFNLTGSLPYERDVFCIEMLDAIAKLYATSYVFKSEQILQWQPVLESKYLDVPGITNLRDFRLSSSACVDSCYSGLYTSSKLQKPNCDKECIPEPYSPCKLSDEKVRQLTEQHDRYIKADVVGYVRPPFLQVPVPQQTNYS